MRPKLKAPIRIRCKDVQGNISYFVVHVDRKVSYYSASETPLAISNIAAGNAAELRFALEDATGPNAALAAVRAKATYARTVEVL